MSSKIKEFLSSLSFKKNEPIETLRQHHTDMMDYFSNEKERIAKTYEHDSFNSINNSLLFHNIVSLIDSLHMGEDNIPKEVYQYKKSINNIYLDVEKNKDKDFNNLEHINNIYTFTFKDEKDTPLFKVEYISQNYYFLRYTIDNVVIKDEQATALLNSVNTISIFKEIQKDGINNVISKQEKKSNNVVDRIMEYRNKNNIPFSNCNTISKL